MKFVMAVLAVSGFVSASSFAATASGRTQLIEKIIAADGVASSNSCARDGSACTFQSDCCSGNCNAYNVCGEGAFCKANGKTCSFDDDCCSGICNSGRCSLSDSGSCKAIGESCTFSSDCCNGSCNANNVCGDQAFCSGIGQSCHFDSDCCSNDCGRDDKCN